MPLIKSPGGSIYPYFYRDGELFCLHYGSFHDDHSALRALMAREEEFVAANLRHVPVWVDFYETKLTDRILVDFVESMKRMLGGVSRLAVVGCSAWNRRRLRRLAARAGLTGAIPLEFFSDPEAAKSWLVGKRN
ncbi:MAG TPA: hypothetical protein VMW69_01115 [Spirochaetia bacterium]|nr:hypothetical protein [Spirochaetia bacterium]